MATVALSYGSREQVLSFTREHDLGFVIVNDPSGDVARPVLWNFRGTLTIALLYQSSAPAN